VPAMVSIGTGVSLSQFAVLGEAMFEDSLVESTGRIRTRSKWFAIGSFLLQAAILTVLILIPYLHPAALPKQALTLLLIAPPPPMARAEVPTHAAVARAATAVMLSALTAPSRIPQHSAMNVTDAAPGDIAPAFERGSDGSRVMDALGKESVPPPPVVIAPKALPGPLRISAGVATGRLLVPIQPIYPAIAQTARIQGTVVVEAVISREGTVENLRVISGPPMLAQAALSAIARARYEPYRLNGEPVEVETTINVVFSLNE
jgi:periplasmic protein TonB